MKKTLYFDCETTGLNPQLNDIIQLGGIIVIDGGEVEKFNLFCQPFSYDNISQEALDTHNFTLEQIKEFPIPQDMYKELITIFAKYIDRFNKADKFIPIGYNVQFDMGFLSEFFKKNGDNYFGSWLSRKTIDPLPIIRFMEFSGLLNLEKNSLSAVCKHFNIEIKAHDALSDIEATKELTELLMKKYFQ